MKKTISILLMLVLMSSLVFAVQEDAGKTDAVAMLTSAEDKGSDEMGKTVDDLSGNQVNTDLETTNKGAESNLQNQVKVTDEAKNQLMQRIEEKRQQFEQEAQSSGKGMQTALKNQNQVRLAVQSLKELSSVMGGIGSQISEIATHFDNSVEKTIQAEEKIQTKSAVSKFFTGGDKTAANEIQSEVETNKQKITELSQLKENCDCDEEVKLMLQEQIQSMEQEQNRLRELADKELKNKGIFGWMFK